MLDASALIARTHHKQEKFRREAEHDRLVDEIGRGTVQSPVSRTAQLSHLWVVLVGFAALLLAVAPRQSEAPVEAATAAGRTASASITAAATSAGPECWVSGDLVGDGNPASIAAALCGR
jgi:hypothetical protein